MTRILPAGDAALAVELGDRIDPEIAARVRDLDGALRARPFDGFLESVPTYRSLLVLFDPERVGADAAAEALRETAATAPAVVTESRVHDVPVVYGGAAGPDFDAVAAAARISPAELIALHTGTEYTAFMLGFTPGFAYLGQLDERLGLPRRATPRERVAAGSVAIANRQTAIYPAASAGGWHLLGRTALRLFDPSREKPALIVPGDRVRFRAVDALPTPAVVETSPVTGTPVVEVLESGLLTTVQDAGRRGYRRLGVGSSGAIDLEALVRANRAVGNPPGAAALECTLAGPALRFLSPLRFAITGADLGAHLERADLGAWPVPAGVAVQARPGNVLRFTGRRSGCRAMLAMAGGIDVPLVLGSRATDLLGGFGGHEGRALRPGDLLAALPARNSAEQSSPEPWSDAEAATVRVVGGPQHEPNALAELVGSEWEVAPGSDRVALRLRGPRIRLSGPAEIVSDGMVPGSIQVPPDGQPIVMLRDSPTTGGYPKIATLLSADLDRLAQLVPGAARVRFSA